ncbi:hypothetical protein E2562_026039 [Oryza meyeriana var. granulata]|uniref:Uncharacterized protein n=1 Tax=Oryza meyeriana var. granulata TaxID=110450 RepID=A0A6G1EPK4_9ORYZ|nr:hypothetical protein E2562_026039 [Oryza meyeriana var. granulata]
MLPRSPEAPPPGVCGNQATRPAARCTRQAPPPDVCSNQETRPAARSTRQGLLQAWRNRRLLACAFYMMKESAMEENSIGSGSGGDAMNIFGQSIDVRRPIKSRRRVTHKNLSPEIEESAGSSTHRLHRRKAIAADQERARAESELSRAMNMAMELERQIEQTNAKARSHRSELQRQGTRASGGRRKTARGLAAEAAGAPAHREGSSTVYGEVMQELDSVKAELHKLQREVKAATAAAKGMAGRDAKASTSRASSGPAVDDGLKREEDEASEDHGVLVELAVAAVSATTHAKESRRDTSSASGHEATPATASSDATLRQAELALVGATEGTAMAPRRREEQGEPSLQAAEAELSSARIELESIKAEGRRFTTSIERTRKETARITDEISRLTEREKKASAQVQQLNAKLLKARSRLEAVTAADEKAEEIISKLTAILRQLDDDTEEAEKEMTLTEMESRCVRADADNVDAEIAVAQQRIRESVKELEATRASEAAATAKLKAVLESATLVTAAAEISRSSGNVTIPRFEYEYLTGRADVVHAVAEKKVAAAEAWAEARRASEKEITMRAEAIERELGEARGADAEAMDGAARAHVEAAGGGEGERRVDDIGNGKVTEDAVLVGDGSGAEAKVAVVQRREEEEESPDTEVSEDYRCEM